MASTSPVAPQINKESIQEKFFRIKHDELISKSYDILEVLNNGSLGAVCKVKKKTSKKDKTSSTSAKIRMLFSSNKKQQRQKQLLEEQREIYALKTINLDAIQPGLLPVLENEVSILSNIDHPNIAFCYEAYVSTVENKMHLVMEYCGADGGKPADLYTKFPYTEKEASIIMKQIIAAIKCMHDHGVVHRDLRFENVLFVRKSGDDLMVNIIDFGLCLKYNTYRNPLTDGPERIYAMSPQALQGKYDKQTDLWSIGVILYMLLMGKRPFFHSKDLKSMVTSIMNAEYYHLHGDDGTGAVTSRKSRRASFLSKYNTISDDAKDLINSLLVVDPKKRLNVEDALQHRWLESDDHLSEVFNTDDRKSGLDVDVFGHTLYEYRQTSALKKVALNVIAHRSNSEEIMKLRKIFQAYDTSNDGFINFDELKNGLLKTTNYSEEVIEEIFESIDVNENGIIMYTEFLAATLEARGRIEEERIYEAFHEIDIDKSGVITKANLRHILGNTNDDDQLLNQVMNEFDENKDGKITYNEFKKAFLKKTTDLASEVRVGKGKKLTTEDLKQFVKDKSQ